MKVLVTGANGHIGCNLVRELRGRGHEVVAMVRRSSDLTGLQGVDVETAWGDVLDGDAVRAAARGCDAVINLAAVYKLGAKDPDAIVRPAVQGIANVLRAAAAHGIARVVHTSSITAIGTARDAASVRDESHWNDAPQSAYYQAKTDSERHAWDLAAELDIPLVVLNPAGILGAYDYRLTPSTAYLVQLAAGRGQTVPGAMAYVDVRDVAWVHAEALTRGDPGERYIVSSVSVDLKELAAHVAERTGRTNAHFPLPRFAIVGFAAASEWAAGLLGRAADTSAEGVREVAHRWARYDNAKARAAFGWTPRGMTEILDHTLRWMAFLGLPDPELAARLGAELPPDPTWVAPGVASP